MRVVVSTEQRFTKTPDGTIWTPNQYSYPFWKRYLDVFESVRVIARVSDVTTPLPKHIPANGKDIDFAIVPYYIGPWQYLRTATAVRRAVRAAAEPHDAIIMRVGGSQLANCLFPKLVKEARPYGVEVVGDPWDVFAPGGVENPLRPALRWYFSSRLKAQCADAVAAAYVTDGVLQRRYPLRTREGRLETTYSSVELAPELFQESTVEQSILSAGHPNFDGNEDTAKATVRLVMVGSLEQLYKGPDLAIEALSYIRNQGLDAHLTIIGDGHFRAQLEALAKKLEVSDVTTFMGQLPTVSDVITELRRSDIFIMPSRTEGLPRAMIEAMACGLPCIGTSVGGIPELLETDDLIAPNDGHALGTKILQVASDSVRRQAMAARNRERARDFRPELLRERRVSFLKFVRQKTEERIQRNHANQAHSSPA